MFNQKGHLWSQGWLEPPGFGQADPLLRHQPAFAELAPEPGATVGGAAGDPEPQRGAGRPQPQRERRRAGARVLEIDSPFF